MLYTIFISLLILLPLAEDMNKKELKQAEKMVKSIHDTKDVAFTFTSKDAVNTLYKYTLDSDIEGYFLFTSSKGRFERFEYAIIYNSKVEIELVKVLAYYSDHGMEITSKKWLSQFEGYQGENLTYGKDIDAISGATYSAASITSDIQKHSRWVQSQVQ